MRYTFEDWKASFSYDDNGLYSSALPDYVEQMIIQVGTDPVRAHIGIFNFPADDYVSLNLSQVLNNGDYFEIYDAENIFGEPVVPSTECLDNKNVKIPRN